MTKIASIWHSDAYLRILNIISMNLSVSRKKKIFEFVCFPRFQNSINDPRKHPNLAKNRKFCQNHQKTTNVGFCDNSFDRSLDMILKYTVSEFFDRKTYFDEITVF